jgi:DNA ligase (NAD+)
MKIIEPTVCPYCGAPIIRLLDDGANIYCSNQFCPERNLEKLKYFVSKECMDIDGISGKTLEKILNNSTYNIHNWWDLYNISKESFMNIGLGEKTSITLINELEKSKSMPGDKVLMALSIPMIGKVNAKKLLDRFTSIQNIEDIACSERKNLIKSEIGEVAGQYVIDYMTANHNVENSELFHVYALLNTVLEENDTRSNIINSTYLSNLTMLASGTFDHFSREEIKESIISNGGKYASGVNSKLNILVIGKEPGPSKLIKAKELGIKIITENEYMNMIHIQNNCDENISESQNTISLF